MAHQIGFQGVNQHRELVLLQKTKNFGFKSRLIAFKTATLTSIWKHSAYIEHTLMFYWVFLREVCNFNLYGSLFKMILQFIYEASYSFSTEDFTAFELPWTPTFFSAFFYTVLPDGLILYNGMKLFLAFFKTFSMTSVFTRYLLTKNSCCNRLKN